MFVIFAAFKRETAGLLRLLKPYKTIKKNNAVIYDGFIKGKRMIICISGIGKANAEFAAGQVINMNLEDPVFIIQGISGAVSNKFKIGDVVLYESVKNLEKFNIIENPADFVCPSPDNQEENKSGADEPAYFPQAHASEGMLYLPYGNKMACSEMENLNGPGGYFFSGQELIEDAFKTINTGFSPPGKGSCQLNTCGLRIFRAAGGAVSHVVIKNQEKDFFNKIYNVEAVDMESYYIAAASAANRIPVICVRSISDNIEKTIPEFMLEFNTVSFFGKIAWLIKVLFSRKKTRELIQAYKNINEACMNLSRFSRSVLLPFFGYRTKQDAG